MGDDARHDNQVDRPLTHGLIRDVHVAALGVAGDREFEIVHGRASPITLRLLLLSYQIISRMKASAKLRRADDWQAGAEEGSKDRPCALVSATVKEAGQRIVVMVPITRRMLSERQREDKELRAQGFRMGAKIQAAAERERTTMLVDADSRAWSRAARAKPRGTKVTSEAYDRDPDFFKLYRLRLYCGLAGAAPAGEPPAGAPSAGAPPAGAIS